MQPRAASIGTMSTKGFSVNANTIGWLALGVMVVAGSMQNAFAKQLSDTFTPLSMMLMSEVLGGFFALLSFGFVPFLKSLLKVKASQLPFMCTMAITNGVLAPLLAYNGLRQTSVANAELFGRMEIVFLLILSVIFLGEKLNRLQIFSGLIILAGAACVALKGFTHDFVLQSGDAMILGSALVYSLGGVILKVKLHKIHPEVIVVNRMFAAILMFLVITPFVSHPFVEDINALTLDVLPALIGFGFVGKFLLLFSFYTAIDQLPVSKVSVAGTLSIAGASLFAYLYLGEPIYWYQILGAAIIIAGAILMQWAGAKKEHHHWHFHLKMHHKHK